MLEKLGSCGFRMRGEVGGEISFGFSHDDATIEVKVPAFPDKEERRPSLTRRRRCTPTRRRRSPCCYQVQLLLVDPESMSVNSKI